MKFSHEDKIEIMKIIAKSSLEIDKFLFPNGFDKFGTIVSVYPIEENCNEKELVFKMCVTLDTESETK